MEWLFNKMNQPTSIKTEQEVKMMAPLVLAYVGDAVFELFIRNHLVLEKSVSVNALHRRATHYVKAKAQAIIIHTLEKDLTEDEWTIVKRGRNQKSATVPKNADLTDYRYATGFETLLGYLFYTGRTERLLEIMTRGIEIINDDSPSKNSHKVKGENVHES